MKEQGYVVRADGGEMHRSKAVEGKVRVAMNALKHDARSAAENAAVESDEREDRRVAGRN